MHPGCISALHQRAGLGWLLRQGKEIWLLQGQGPSHRPERIFRLSATGGLCFLCLCCCCAWAWHGDLRPRSQEQPVPRSEQATWQSWDMRLERSPSNPYENSFLFLAVPITLEPGDEEDRLKIFKLLARTAESSLVGRLGVSLRVFPGSLWMREVQR